MYKINHINQHFTTTLMGVNEMICLILVSAFNFQVGFGYKLFPACLRFPLLHFYLLLFFWQALKCIVQHCSGTVYRTHNYFIEKKYIKNGSHDTIHTFKNYFATIFSIFSKISCIQMNPQFLSTLFKTLLFFSFSPHLFKNFQVTSILQHNYNKKFSTKPLIHQIVKYLLDSRPFVMHCTFFPTCKPRYAHNGKSLA